MPFTCPKWECRHEIPFSKSIDTCPECGTYLFLTKPPEVAEPDEALPEKETKPKKPKPEKAYPSRATRPLNDKEIKQLLEEEERSWREPINDYYNDISY